MKISGIKRRYIILLGITVSAILIPVLFLFSAPTNKSACCSIGTSYGSSIVNPAKGGDNDQFTIPALPPNIIWLLDTSGSMRDIACGGNCDSVNTYAGFRRCNLASSPNYGRVYPSLSSCGTNCSGTGNCVTVSPCGLNRNLYPDALNRLGYSWTQTTSSPYDTDTLPYNSFEDQSDPHTPADGLFEAYRVYTGPNTWGSCGMTWSAYGYDVVRCGGTVTATKYECNTTGDQYNNLTPCLSNCSGSCFIKPIAGSCNSSCQTCVQNLRQRGYYYISSWWGGTYYFSGNFLNYYPPKYVIARKVLKDVINDPDVRKIRMGLFRFDGGGSIPGTNCGYCYDYGCGACIMADLNPPCPLCLNEGAAYDSNRTALTNALNNTTVSRFNTNTPTAEALFNVGQYYSGEYPSVFGPGTTKNGLNPQSGANDSIYYTCMQNYAVIITDGLPTQDGNQYKLPTRVGDSDGDANPCDRAGSFNPAVCPPYGTTGYGHLLDDVAYSLYNRDLRPSMDGTQRVVTYTIGFGTQVFEGSEDLLRRTATNSTGLYFSADNKEALADSLKRVLEDVIRRATSYSNISTASVQVSSTSGAFIPRFFPSTASFWKGYLYAFRQYNEVLTGVNLNNDTDPNTGLPDLTDQLIVDRDNDIVTVDNNTGYPVKQSSGGTANEFWEAGRCLSDPTYRSGTCYTASGDRRIYTAIDLNNDGTISSNEQIEFRSDLPPSQFAVLRDYLWLEGNNYCSDLSTQLGFTFPDATKVSACASKTDPTDYCACLLIEFIRGRDILDEDGDGDRNDDRPWKLGDIFHSTPQMISPPDKLYCPYNQCLRTLFQPVDITGTENGPSAFDNFVEYYGKRDQVVLVGANDGMLHAFHAGDVIIGDNPESVFFVEQYYYDQGTGKELWAFIPPDLLPKLKNLTYPSGKHNYFVDSTPWIRNIWYDANNNYTKDCTGVGGVDSCEIRTIVVSGERGGGSHYFALDVTNVDSPQFRWIFPQPCSEDALKMGMSYAEALPQPPPIGPIKFIDPSNPHNNEFRERYIVFLNGGYDAVDLKGRGIFMLDAWTGEKIYEATYDPTDSIKSNMKYSVPAPVYADDWKKDPSVCIYDPTNDYDYFWDIASFGDMGGQVWTLRFISPDPSRWYIARTFEQENHLPFFYISQTIVRLGSCQDARIFLGTGDRENINDCNGGDCKYDNIRACALKGCKIEVGVEQEVNGKLLEAEIKWDGSIVPITEEWAWEITSNNACSSINYSHELEIEDCPEVPNDPEFEKEVELECTTNPFTCTEEVEYDGVTIEIPGTNTNTARHKFYAINYSREFVDDPLKASVIDASRKRDSDLPLPGDAVSAESPGWQFMYENPLRLTATGAVQVGDEGCIVWDAYEPNCSTGGGTQDPCYTPGAGTAYLYNANARNGKPGCGRLFKFGGTALRSIQIGSTIPPPPTLSVVIAGNRIYTYFIGGEWWNPVGALGSVSTIPGYIYWMEVPKPLHDCKHEGKCY